MTRGPRYTDSKDFDEIHDEITTWVMNNYSAINAKLIEKENGARYDMLYNEYPIFRGKIEVLSEEIKVEEQFDEFYPDIKITGRFGIHHAGNLVLDIANEPYKLVFSLRCPICGNESRSVAVKSADYDQHFKDNNARSEQDYYDALVRLLGWTDTKLEEKEGKTISNRVWKEDYYCYKFDFLNIIEVKSHIKSFGEVMRQLQSYKGALKSWKIDDVWKFGQVALITPDTRFNEYFEKQGFTVITYRYDSGLKSLDYFDNNRKLTVDPSEIGQDLDLKEKGGAGND